MPTHILVTKNKHSPKHAEDNAVLRSRSVSSSTLEVWRRGMPFSRACAGSSPSAGVWVALRRDDMSSGPHLRNHTPSTVQARVTRSKAGPPAARAGRPPAGQSQSDQVRVSKQRNGEGFAGGLRTHASESTTYCLAGGSHARNVFSIYISIH